MATNLKFLTGAASNYDKITSPESGTVYFATESDGRAYIYLNGNNIIPRMADLRNGGLGVSHATAAAYSVLMTDSDGKKTTVSAPAAGAFYTDAASNKPKFGTLPVAQGGSGRTSLTSGAILYGNGTGIVNLLSASTTNGYVLVSNGSAPIYTKPTMSWTNGSTAGPIFNFTFNGTSIAGVAIPKASDSISGVVTTDGQKFTGEKTFMSTTHASTILPRTSNAYSLGSASMIWNRIYSHGIQIYDTNKNAVLNTSIIDGTTTKDGVCGLTLGNSIVAGNTGNSQGRLYLYGSGSGAGSLYYANVNSTTNQMIPAASGTVMISDTLEYLNTTGANFRIPFYESYNNTTMKLGYTHGLLFRYKSSAEGDSSAGTASIYLGTNYGIGEANNLQGGICLYSDNTGYSYILPNPDNGANENTLYLPNASGELVYHVRDSAQGGAGTDSSSNVTYKPVHVSAAGAVTAASSTVASSTRLMYMNSGALTASTANVANGKKQLMYLSNGTLTASDADVASDTELMYLLDGVLTKSTANVASNKKLMYLAQGKLTVSDADVGGATKPIYLEDGELKPASSTIASSTQLMYMNGGTLTPSTADMGSATQPVYLLDGVITAAKDYSTLLTAFSGSSSASDNTASITVGGTTKTATIIGGVSNTWANGTSSGPTLSTTVNGKAGTAVAIPSASYSYSGVVTTGAQTLKGTKTFAEGIKIANGNSTTDCATLTYDGDTLTISFG